jgi:putative transposase
MRCPACGSSAIRERPERTTQGYRRFRCQCGKQFNERSSDVLNKAQYPNDVIALVVLWRLRYKLSLRDLAEMFLTRSFIFTYEAGAGVGSQAHPGSDRAPAPQTQGQSRSQLVRR